jgi:exosortase D (VPLPA-CTERM-specific)
MTVIAVKRSGADTRDLANSALWAAVASVGLVSFFWTGLASLPDVWSRPEYSHGFLIPFIAAFLLLGRLRGIERIEPVHRWVGLTVVALGVAVGSIGNLAHIPDVVIYGFVICLAGLLLVAVGLRTGLRLWVPVVYLAFVIPLPNFLYLKLSTQLKAVSSQLGAWLIDAFGVPVHLDGNIIDLGVYQLEVAQACSGLNYLFPLLSFGFLFAALYRGPTWHKLILFLSAIPITIFMNSLRIGIIGVLVDRYGIAQAEGFLHFFEGWVIFGVCLVLLFSEAWLLQRLTRRPRSIARMLDLTTSGLVAQARWLAGSSSRLAGAAVIIAAAGIAWQLIPSPAVSSPSRDPLALFPLELGNWRGYTASLDANVSRVLAADDYLLADFRSTQQAAPVNLFIAYYDSQIAGSGIHSPEVCLPAGGWEVSRWETLRSNFKLPSGELLEVNRAVIQKGLDRQLVYYWFEERGRPMTGDLAAKIATVWDSVTLGRTDGALVRLVTPVGRGESIETSDRRLETFLSRSYSQLPRFIPG